MPASAMEQGAVPSDLEVCVEMHALGGDQLAAGSCQPANSRSPSDKVVALGRKRALDAMQNDGQATVKVATKTIEDTSYRTSSENEQQQRRGSGGSIRIDAGLPPMVPVKVAPKTSLSSEGVAAAIEANEQAVNKKGRNAKTTAVKVLEAVEEETRRRDSTRRPAATKKPAAAKVNAKLGNVKMSKKVAAKSERVDRRRKREKKDMSKPTSISQTSAKMLLQLSCQLLQRQTLDNDVRAREMEERNTKQAEEIEEWEKRIRSLKRELEEYTDELSEMRPKESTGVALVDTLAAAVDPTSGEQASLLSPAASAAVLGDTAGVESSLAPAVVAAEAKLQEELRRRTQMVNEFRRSLPGFIHSLDEQGPHPF